MTGHCDRASCQIAESDACECVCFGCTFAKLQEGRGIRIRKVRPEDMAAEAALLPKPQLDTSPVEGDEADQLQDQDPLADIAEILELPNEHEFGDR